MIQIINGLDYLVIVDFDGVCTSIKTKGFLFLLAISKNWGMFYS